MDTYHMKSEFIHIPFITTHNILYIGREGHNFQYHTPNGIAMCNINE